MALQDIVEQTVTGLGYDLVEIERSAGGLLRVTIDLPWDAQAEPQFVTVEDCEKVTRQLQFALEVEGADSSTRCNKDEPGNGWLRMSRHHGHSNRQVQVARCTSTSAEKNDTKFTAS